MKRPMRHLQIVGLLADLESTLETLQQLACVEIVPASTGRGKLTPDAGDVQDEEAVNYLLARLDALLTTLSVSREPSPPIAAGELTSIRAQLTQLTSAVHPLTRKRESLQNEQQTLPRYQGILRKLVPLIPDEAQRSTSAATVVLVAEAQRWVLRELRTQVAALTEEQHFVVEENIGDGLRDMMIIVPAARSSALGTLLGEKEIAQMQMPEGFSNRPPDETVAALEQRLAALPVEIADLDQQLRTLGHEWGQQLLGWRRDLTARKARHEIREMLGATAQAFIIEGWCPEEELTAVCHALTRFPTVHITDVEPDAGDDVPVALVNPRPVRPFESLVRLIAYPRYDGIDPTGLMALFLPLFFGMILGDIGYGAVIFLAASMALQRIPERGTKRDILHVLQIGAVWGILFGLLFGELFGTLGEKLGLHALWLERAAPEYVTALLLFTIGLGAIHITLGLVLGVWLSWQSHNRRRLLERGGMLVGLLGMMVLTAALTRQIPDVLATPGVAAMLVGLVLLSASHGWLGLLLGPIEFIGLLGNVLSYLRIAAVGLASVYVALVANELAGSLGSLLLGIVVAVLIHALNIVLGAFSPTIHSLRLHYVEFFRKFYEGGGRPFRPFGATGS